MALKRLSAIDQIFTVAGAGGDTLFGGAFLTDIIGNFHASLELSSIGGTAPDYSITIQHSPDPEDIAAASAVWYDLMSFAANMVANTNEDKANTEQHFSRMRIKVVITGTDPTAKLSVIIEGAQLSLLEGNK